MLSLIIADKSFAARERSMLFRLEVGLADEGVRTVHAAPLDAVGSHPASPGLQSTIVPIEPRRGPLFSRPAREAARLLHAIEDDGLPAAVDVVHVFGPECWALGMEAARLAKAALLIEVFKPSLLSAAVDLYQSAGRNQPAPAFLTCEPTVASALTKSVPQARVYSAPWGVHAPTSARARRASNRPPSIAVLFDSAEARTVAACLGGIVAAGSCVGESLVEMSISESTTSRESRLWAGARRAGIVDRASILSDMESRREPVLDMDLLLLPESSGWERTFVLEAMAAGLVVLAAPDPALDYLVDGSTAALVPSNTPSAWAAALRRLVESPDSLNALRASAHAHVRSNRTASAQIEGVLKAYRLVSQPAPAT